jgi:hypothetical protein
MRKTILRKHTPLLLLLIIPAGLFLIMPSCGGGKGNSSIDTTKTTMQIPVPDTGQTMNHTTIFGEDSDYTINSLSYMDNGDGTITDNVTGLVWQKQDDDVPRTWGDANTYCATVSLDGTGWRLPSIIELTTIIDYDFFTPSIDASYFPNTQLATYWSSTMYAGSLSFAWGVLFNGGELVCNNITSLGRVRCVRGKQSPSVFIDGNNGTVTDVITNLMWQKQDDAITRSWEEAINFCEGLSLGGFADWRLPNVKELISIVDYTKVNPAINSTYFPNTQPAYYWSSTYVWLVAFGSGTTSSGYNMASLHYARCVRGGQ